jgi:hypothetical protein
MSKGLPLFPMQLVVRVKAYGRQHDDLRRTCANANLAAFSSPKKDAVVVILKDRVEPGSEARKIYPEVSGGVLHIQANECGPFGKVSGGSAQVVTDLEGNPMKPLVNFNEMAKAKKGHVTPGGHVAIFDAPALVVVKGYQEREEIMIAKFTPIVENGAATIKSDLICVVPSTGDLPEEHSKFANAVKALRLRLTEVGTTEMFYGA